MNTIAIKSRVRQAYKPIDITSWHPLWAGVVSAAGGHDRFTLNVGREISLYQEISAWDIIIMNIMAEYYRFVLFLRVHSSG